MFGFRSSNPLPRMRHFLHNAVVALALALAVPAAAATTLQQPDQIRARQAQISAGLQAGNSPYAELSTRAREELTERQARMLALLEGKQRIDELDADAQAQVEADARWIENAVSRAEDERMVCERRRVLGSNRKERVCKTVAQLREEREAARNAMDARGTCMNCAD